jgi:hypothetical protein
MSSGWVLIRQSSRYCCFHHARHHCQHCFCRVVLALFTAIGIFYLEGRPLSVYPRYSFHSARALAILLDSLHIQIGDVF